MPTAVRETVLDWVKTHPRLDASRIMATGGSYGGFMTCWLTGHDDRFMAAVAGGTTSLSGHSWTFV